MRLTIKLFAAAVTCFGLAGTAVAAAAGGVPADMMLGAMRPSNIIMFVAGFAMIGLAAGRGNATSAIGKAGFQSGGNSIARWLTPRRAVRSQSLSRIAQADGFEPAKGLRLAA